MSMAYERGYMDLAPRPARGKGIGNGSQSKYRELYQGPKPRNVQPDRDLYAQLSQAYSMKMPGYPDQESCQDCYGDSCQDCYGGMGDCCPGDDCEGDSCHDHGHGHSHGSPYAMGGQPQYGKQQKSPMYA